MLVSDPVLVAAREVTLVHPSFRSWQRDTVLNGLVPVIGIGGTRGKSTVLRLVESMLITMHLRRATWTDLGVHIQGRRQRGEIAGWRHALTRLAEGSIDVALQELDWATVNAAGLPAGSYPVIALCGLREHTESPDSSNELQIAIRASRKCVSAVHHDGFLVINGDDAYAVDAAADCDATTILVSKSFQSPFLQHHLADGGAGVWVRSGHIWVGDHQHAARVGRVSDFPITMQGEATFNVTDVLLAIAIGRGMGLDIPSIVQSLQRFRAAWDILPASMNVYDTDNYRAVIDQLGPGWVIKAVLRAVNPSAEQRQITVVGDLGWIAAEEVYELGRQLGRYHGAIVMHGEQERSRLDEFRRGLSANEYPPLFIWVPTERRAINRAFKTLKQGDCLLILTTHDSSAAHRSVRRHIASD
jgi:cyanophycin synthetase